MLISFSVANFRSFKEEQTLSLIASKRLGSDASSLDCAELPGTDEHVLRVASLYGANGAGKSNVVKALGFVSRLVRRGTAAGKRISHRPFLFSSETATGPSSFELQFVEDGSVLRYGFCCDATRIHEEWLDVYEGAKEKSVFARTTDQQGGVQVRLGPAVTSSTAGKTKALADVGARPNQPKARCSLLSPTGSPTGSLIIGPDAQSFRSP